MKVIVTFIWVRLSLAFASGGIVELVAPAPPTGWTWNSGRLYRSFDDQQDVPVGEDEYDHREKELPRHVEYPESDPIAWIRPERAAETLAVDHACGDPRWRYVDQGSVDPAGGDRNVGHPLAEIFPVGDRVNDFPVPFQSDDDETGCRSVQAGPDEDLIVDRLAYEPSWYPFQVRIDQKRGVGHDQRYASEEVQRGLVQNQSVPRLLVLRRDQDVQHQTVGKRPNYPDADDGNLEISVIGQRWGIFSCGVAETGVARYRCVFRVPIFHTWSELAPIWEHTHKHWYVSCTVETVLYPMVWHRII